MIRCAALLTVLVGCTPSSPPGDGGGGGPTDPTRCSPNVAAVADEGAVHVPYGEPVIYRHQPPASGPHWFGANAPHAWGVYLDEAIPPEEFVHNLEHGGVVFLFNCPPPLAFNYDLGQSPDGAGGMPCPELTSVLAAVASEKSVGMLVTGWPLPTKKVTALAWDWIYQSDTADATELRCFRDARWGNGPEKVF